MKYVLWFSLKTEYYLIVWLISSFYSPLVQEKLELEKEAMARIEQAQKDVSIDSVYNNIWVKENRQLVKQ